MKLNINIDTQISGSEITQEVFTQLDEVRHTILRQVIQMQDAGVREALIKLGWTPPGQTPAAPGQEPVTVCPKCGSDEFDTVQWSERSGISPFEPYGSCRCGHEWVLPTDAAPVQEPVYQYQRADGSWIDQTKESHDYNVRHGQATVRVVYATQPAAPVQEPVEQERESLRAAQSEAVMPLIGPLLDAWESCSETMRSEQPEVDKYLRKINRAMEDAEPFAAPMQREHITDKSCWCHPTLDYKNPDTGAEVWVHNEPH